MHDIMFPGLPDISNVILLPALQSSIMYRMPRVSLFLFLFHPLVYLYQDIPCLPTSCLRGTYISSVSLGIGYFPSTGIYHLPSSGKFEQSHVTL